VCDRCTRLCGTTKRRTDQAMRAAVLLIAAGLATTGVAGARCAGIITRRRPSGIRTRATDRVLPQAARGRIADPLSVLPLRRKNEPACRHPGPQCVHELSFAPDQADRRDREAQGSRSAEAGDCVDQGPQPARLRVLQPQSARRRRGDLSLVPRPGGNDGADPSGRAAHDGLVSGVSSNARSGASAATSGGSQSRASRRADPWIGLREMPLLGQAEADAAESA